MMPVDLYLPLADKRISEWFLQENARRERHREENSRTPPQRTIITISRQFGAGGHTIASKLAEQLGEPWQVWDSEIIEAVAKSGKVRTEMVQAMDERTRSWLEYMLFSLGEEYMHLTTYRRHLMAVLLTLAQQGCKIIIGRGANFVLKDGLNVRLQASMHSRIQETMRREDIPHEAAQKRLQEVDSERAAFTRTVFSRDVENFDAYDMVLTTDSLGCDASVAAIIAAMRVKSARQE